MREEATEQQAQENLRQDTTVSYSRLFPINEEIYLERLPQTSVAITITSMLLKALSEIDLAIYFSPV